MSRRTMGEAVLLASDLEAGSPEWHQLRRGRLGASEIAAVVGLSPYQSPFSLWHQKAGNVDPQRDNVSMSWGRALERVIAEHYGRLHPNIKLSHCGLYAHRDRPWQVAQPDRVIHLGARKLAALEVKTERFADEWGEEGTDDIPVNYRCQAIWQMDVFGWHECRFAVLMMGTDYREYIVPYDAGEAELLRKAAREFLASLEAGKPPPIDDHTATYRAVRKLHPDIDDVDIEVPRIVADSYRRAIDAHRHAETLKRDNDSMLLDLLGTARRALLDGKTVATRCKSPHGAPPHLRPPRKPRKDTTTNA